MYYDYGKDEVIGFEDSGIVKTCNPANYATVTMARGIKQSWKQPLGYMFSTTGMTAPNLKVMIHNFIKKLVEIGLTVVGLVTDMGSNFQQLANILDVRNNNSKIVLGDLVLFMPRRWTSVRIHICIINKSSIQMNLFTVQ